MILICRNKEKNLNIIFSNFLSNLEAVNGFKLEIDLVQNIIKHCTHTTDSSKTIFLCLISSHFGIWGNEGSNTAAKSALYLPITNMKLPASELVLPIVTSCLDKWHHIWDCCKGNKIHDIFLTTGNVTARNIACHDFILLNRLIIFWPWFYVLFLQFVSYHLIL